LPTIQLHYSILVVREKLNILVFCDTDRCIMSEMKSALIVSEMRDFLDGKGVDPSLLKPATKCMAVHAMVQYFLTKGANLTEIFRGADVTPDFVSNPDSWISYRDMVVLMKNCHDAIPGNTVYDWLQAGIGISDFVQSKKYVLITNIVGIKLMYQKTIELMGTLNNYANIELNSLENGFCDCLYISEEKFNRFGLGHAAHWTAGVLAAIPKGRGHDPADVKIQYSHHMLRNLIQILYSKQNFDYFENDGGHIFVDGELKAKRVELLKDEETGVLTSKYIEESNKTNAILVVDKIEKQDVLYVQEGEIFDAPYGRFEFRWKPEKRFRSLSTFLEKRQNTKTLIGELENQIATADKRTIEAQTARNAERTARIRAEEAEKEVKVYADNLESLVDQRTNELKQAQVQLVEVEKRTLEHRITGGFAHEMRNALAGAQLEFKTTLNYKDQGKPSAEILKESATKLLKNIAELHSEFKIPREKIVTLLLPELKTIAEIADHLNGVHTDVSSDLDRGLSITTQIRDYAKMSEIKPGDDAVDIGPLLRSYQDRYKLDFERIGITYTAEGLETAVVQADETHINSILSNLILNAKDALEEVETDRPKKIKVTVEKQDDETEKNVVIAVVDNGPGIPEESLNEIFEPFYSTKPTTGTGLGLGVVKRLVQLYGGTIEVKSNLGEGTTFTVTLKEREHG
jgi:signal transduction histidine kinase